MAKLDLYNQEWIDVVFTGRNQEYGAYQLRKNNSRMTNLAMFSGALFFTLIMSAPLISRYINGAESNNGIVQLPLTNVTLITAPAIDKLAPPPLKVVEPTQPRVSQIKFPPLVVVPANQVSNVDPPTVDELKIADPGPKTVTGNPDAAVQIDGPVGTSPGTKSVVIEDETVHPFEELEQMPEYPGGLAKFYSYIGKNYVYPASARESEVSGRIVMSFIVEKDGSLTDIKVLKDLGMGTGEEATRLLRKTIKWTPGIQNGRAVRVQYTLPIMLNLEGQ
ncbi:energy transducer TonB [Arcticibacter eurypsychrophilus]|uniref:energy transducer TonB n=1 Tax=Arcticibacter eurypsychrophilus TaxID=1434752 RepID=UPI00084DC5D4|nr:energy transducer TonB [Arcticibacter eurypsychrophilus]